LAALGCAAAVALPVAAAGAWASPASASASASPLTVAYITTETGVASTQYVGVVPVFKAALEAQNAKGGVNGHQLVPLVIDDQTSPATAVTAAQEAISRGVIGIVANSALTGLFAKYPQQAGMPVVGDNSDGPEWGMQPNTNMFGTGATGSTDPSYPISTMYGNAVKAIGITKPRLAVYALSISPLSVASNANVSESVKRQIPSTQTAVDDRSVQFGSTAFGPTALSGKQNNVNVVWPNLDAKADIALSNAYRQAGSTAKFLLPSGYDPLLVHSPSWSGVQGDYFEVDFHPFYEPNAGTMQMQSALEKYAGWSKSQYPTYSQDVAWLSAELMIKGLEGAGSNPTHASVINSLHNITNWNGNGILPFSINYKTSFGKPAAANCVWLTKATANGFTPVGKNPVCGHYIPGTSTAGSS
jgi:branched-chain amino acid transport system substrate-binding protein